MPKDFNLTVNPLTGRIGFEYTFNNNIKNNIITSVNVVREMYFKNPSFGSRLKTLTKNISDTVELAKAYLKNALQWLIDIGRAISVKVEVTQHKTNLNRIDIVVDVVQADGLNITYATFQELL